MYGAIGNVSDMSQEWEQLEGCDKKMVDWESSCFMVWGNPGGLYGSNGLEVPTEGRKAVQMV